MRICFTLFLSVISIYLNAHVLTGGSSQLEEPVISETRQHYLDKAGNIEYQLKSIDIKWNWVIARPVEDSIAKAQGWYSQMEARRNQLTLDLVQAKVEQICNYYQDLTDQFGHQDEVLKSKIGSMEANRNQFAPNYPAIDEYIPQTSTSLHLLEEWIKSYPDEYSAFTNSLEKLVLGQ
jgi:hypothetical protein